MIEFMRAFRSHICKNKLTGAFEFPDGSTEHYRHGKRHREDAPAILTANGSKLWYQHDELHRTDGPAVEWANGDKEWWRNGRPHRDDGPALEMNNGTTKKYFIDGVEIPAA